MNNSSEEPAWFRTAQYIATAITAAGTIYIALQQIWNVASDWRKDNPNVDILAPAQDIITALQLLVITFIVVTLVFRHGLPDLHPPTHPKREKEDFPRAKKAAQQFSTFWFYTWVSWLFLYSAFVLITLKISLGIDAFSWNLIKDLFALLASSGLYFCYRVMTKPTVAPDDQHWHEEVTLVLVACFCVIGLQGYATAHAVDVARMQYYFEAFEGLLSGIGLALLIGRFAGRLIAFPPVIVAALYAYAVIQILLPSLTSPVPIHPAVIETLGHAVKKALDPAVLKALDSAVTALDATAQKAFEMDSLVFISMALIFKIILFVEVRSAMQKGILTYYMLEYKILNDRDQKHRQKMLDDMHRRPPSDDNGHRIRRR
jgi:small basic protein